MYRDSKNRKIDSDTKSKLPIGKQRCEKQNKVMKKAKVSRKRIIRA